MISQVSIIIVNYNAGTKLSQCIQSVLRTDLELEVFVVDNNSRDASLNDLQKVCPDDKRVTILQNAQNLGFAVACNQGTENAKGDFLFYLNPDCVVEPETIPNLLSVMHEYEDLGMVGGLILNPDGTEQRGCRRAIPSPWRSLVNTLGLGNLSLGKRKIFSDFRLDREPLPAGPVEVEAISGACMLVRKEAYLDVGPMDEGYFLHCEDLDWCLRFRQRGWKIMFVPKARLMHAKGSCSSSRPVFVEWAKHKGMVRFYRKFFRDKYTTPMFWLVVLGIWLRFCLALSKIFLSRIGIAKSG